jgi:hypothetical protein
MPEEGGRFTHNDKIIQELQLLTVKIDSRLSVLNTDHVRDAIIKQVKVIRDAQDEVIHALDKLMAIMGSSLYDL